MTDPADYIETDRPECFGSGETDGIPCTYCNGTGRTEMTRDDIREMRLCNRIDLMDTPYGDLQ